MKKLSLALALVLCISILPSCSEEVTLEPNADFGMVSDKVYAIGNEIAITEQEGDTDMVSVDLYYPNYPDNVYSYYMRPRWYGAWPTDRGGLTLHMKMTVAEGYTFALTREESHLQADNTLQGEEYECGIIEVLDESGEWIEKGSIYDTTTFFRTYAVLEPGERDVSVSLPIHEPGKYRLTWYFRDYTIERTPVTRGTLYITGDTQYSTSAIITIPEATEKKFDLVSVDLTPANDGASARVAAMCRSNDGVIPYQDLRATKLEIWERGEWRDVSNDITAVYDVTRARNPTSQSDLDISATGYVVNHPFAKRSTVNLLCGTAEARLRDKNARYRVTFEFCENRDGSGERWALQFEFSMLTAE